METPQPQTKIAAEWADFVINVWLTQMSKLGVNNALFYARSFQHTVVSNANGDVERISFTFEHFLRFTDMGVGNGTKLSESLAGQTNRKRKQWLSKTLLREVRILIDIMAQNYGRQAQSIITSNLEHNGK